MASKYLAADVAELEVVLLVILIAFNFKEKTIHPDRVRIKFPVCERKQFSFAPSCKNNFGSSASHKCYMDHPWYVTGEMGKLSQMPLVLLPVHFDRDAMSHVPSCQHSVVLRTFVTHDFMTGIAATPGTHISETVDG